MPIYLHECESCKDPQGNPLQFDDLRSCARSSDKAICPSCSKPCERSYSGRYESASDYKPKKFVPFYDEAAKCLVTSRSQESRLMKQQGKIFLEDAPKSNRIKETIKEWKWKRDRGLV